MTRQKYILFDLILLSITAIWGITFVIVQDAIVLVPPFTFLALRFGLATLLLWPATYFQQKRSVIKTQVDFVSSKQEKNPKRPLIRAGIILGTILFLAYALQTFSLLYTTSGKAGFLTGLSVALVPLLALLLLKMRPRLASLAGVACAVAGLYLLAFADIHAINQGDVLAFGCAIAFGLQIVCTAKFAEHVPIYPLVTLQMATVAVFSSISMLIWEPWQQMLHSAILSKPEVWLALLITGVLATAFAFLAQTRIQQYVSPTRVALIFTCEPVFAALADLLWNGHLLDTRGLFGCTLILCSMLSEVLVNAKSIARLRVDNWNLRRLRIRR